MVQHCSLLAAVSGMPLAGWKILSNGLWSVIKQHLCPRGGTDKIFALERLLLVPPFESEHNSSRLVATYGMHKLSPFLYCQGGCEK